MCAFFLFIAVIVVFFFFFRYQFFIVFILRFFPFLISYRRMPIQAPQWTEFLSCPVCCHQFAVKLRPPISLGCGHTICKTCLANLHRKQCPFDQVRFKKKNFTCRLITYKFISNSRLCLVLFVLLLLLFFLCTGCNNHRFR